MSAVIFSNFLFHDAETVGFEEQIISKDKYLFVFSRKIDAIVFFILQIFCDAREKC